MSEEFKFVRQNLRWNLDPNDPNPHVRNLADCLRLTFNLNAYDCKEFHQGELGILDFHDASRYRLSETNEEGWYRGQSRFSGMDPAWEQFYVVEGDRSLLKQPNDWHIRSASSPGSKHFIFFFLDNTFECVCQRWSFAQIPENALLRLSAL